MILWTYLETYLSNTKWTWLDDFLSREYSSFNFYWKNNEVYSITINYVNKFIVTITKDINNRKGIKTAYFNTLIEVRDSIVWLMIKEWFKENPELINKRINSFKDFDFSKENDLFLDEKYNLYIKKMRRNKPCYLAKIPQEYITLEMCELAVSKVTWTYEFWKLIDAIHKYKVKLTKEQQSIIKDLLFEYWYNYLLDDIFVPELNWTIDEIKEVLKRCPSSIKYISPLNCSEYETLQLFTLEYDYWSYHQMTCPTWKVKKRYQELREKLESELKRWYKYSYRYNFLYSSQYTKKILWELSQFIKEKFIVFHTGINPSKTNITIVEVTVSVSTNSREDVENFDLELLEFFKRKWISNPTLKEVVVN